MKQYKLIKWYPSLPKDWEVGMIVGLEDRCIPTSFSPCNRKYKDYYVSYEDVINNSEFWEEIIEYPVGTKVLDTFSNENEYCYTKQDYEILSFITIKSVLIKYNDLDINDELNCDKYLKIYSVKRLSDGEVFTIGDKIEDKGLLFWVIDSFRIVDNIVKLECERSIKTTTSASLLLNESFKVKKPLLTTEDGVDIFKGDSPWTTLSNTKCEGFKNVKQFKNITENANRTFYKYFSSKEKAEEYVRLNTVLFTTNDGVDIKKGDKYFELVLTFKPIFREAIYEEIGRPNIFYDYNIPEKKKKLNNNGRYYFSTKEAAEEYILMNKPCLSLNDVGQFYKKLLDFSNGNSKGLLELIKFKL